MIKNVNSRLSLLDRLGSILVRFSFNRSDYKVGPGLYALNNPSPDAPVFLSANYKLSFDILRSSLKGFGSWILVLDTKGINVWCAAGKGTFGTEELINQIKLAQLDKVVSHRQVISPQLGATGIAAHEVQKQAGFQVVYGPVRADDLPAFIKDNFNTTADMRRVKFTLADRLILVPVELIQSSRYLFFCLLFFWLLSGLDLHGYSIEKAGSFWIYPILYLLAAYLAGAFLGPVLLPWLPGRSFSLKGALLGLLVTLLLHFSLLGLTALLLAVFLLINMAMTSYLLMNFTGASTYTSISGVKKEMHLAVPLQIIALVIGVTLYIIGMLWG